MRLTRCALKAPRFPCSSQLKEGWAYVSGFAPVRTILLLFAMVSLMGWPFTVLMPIFAGNDFEGRSAHAWFSDGCRGYRRPGFGDFAGPAKDCAGAGQDDSDFDRRLWAWV